MCWRRFYFRHIANDSTNLLHRLGTGAAGPAFFGLGTAQCLIILTIVDLL